MGVAGFEPATSPSSAVCSPGLNYTPELYVLRNMRALEQKFLSATTREFRRQWLAQPPWDNYFLLCLV